MIGHYVNDSGVLCRCNAKGTEVCIADFRVEVDKVKIYLDIDGNECSRGYCVRYYTDKFIGCDEISSEHLEKYDYSAYSPELLLSPVVKSAAKEVAYYIYSEAKKAPTESIIRFERLGWHRKADGTYYYCAGDTVISADMSTDIAIAPALSNKFRLEIDDSLEEATAADRALCHASIDGEYSSVIFATGILGLIRQLILDADIKPPSIIYLVGNSQSRKTSLSKLCCLMYNRSRLQSDSNTGISRISSSEAKTEALTDEYKDAAYIVDDLYATPDSKVKRENERRLRNVIRNYADNSPRQTMHGGYQNSAQILVTGEYLLNTKTDVGRCFVIKVNRQINSAALAKYQNQPLVLSTAYFYFIKWLCTHYDETVEKLRQGFAQMRRETYAHKIGYERLYEQAFLLDFAFGLFCDYAVKAGGIEQSVCEKAKRTFGEITTSAVEFQGEIMKNLERKETTQINYSKELVQLLREEYIILGKKGSRCFRKKNHIYITCNYLTDVLYEKHGLRVTSKAVTKYFSDRHINEKDGDKNVVKYGEAGKRYLVLDESRLAQDAQSLEAEIESLFR